MNEVRPETILVVDVESTCWEGAPPDGETSEIIEVGVTTLNPVTLERDGKWNRRVRPTRSQVSPFCTSLTGIRAEDVADAPELREVCAWLERELASRERVWVSWGAYDRNQFRSNCEERGIAYPFGERHANLKALFAERFRLKRPCGMIAALRRLGLYPEGTHHNGGDDAWNTAAILARMLERDPNLLEPVT